VIPEINENILKPSASVSIISGEKQQDVESLPLMEIEQIHLSLAILFVYAYYQVCG
jgi:hypothetical protein